MTDFQVGDRVSVEGVITEFEAPDVALVQVACSGPTVIHVKSLTLVERPRRKLWVGSVWERWGVLYSVGKDEDGYQQLVSLRDGGILDISLIGVSHPDCWREVPVEELEREAR